MFACFVMVTVIAVTLFTKPVYEATVRVEVDPSGEKFSLNGAPVPTDTEYLETQAQVLQGDTLAIEVIRKLRLDQNPAVMGKLDAEALKESNIRPVDPQQLTPEESSALVSLRDALRSSATLPAGSSWSVIPVPILNSRPRWPIRRWAFLSTRVFRAGTTR